MTRDDDDHRDSSDKPRRPPVFTGFDEEDSYEEPDRDTDYASIFTDEDEREQPAPYGDDVAAEDETLTPVDPDWEEPGLWDTSPQAAPTRDPASDTADIDDDWSDEEDYPEGDLGQAEPWPVGLIIVAVVALLLLGAGGYGVMQQRSATQEEIRQLQAALATAGSPQEAAAGRTALHEVEQRNAELQGSVDDLTLENRRLEDTVAGLESQLKAQQETIARQAAKAAVPKPAAPAPVTAKSVTPQPTAPKPSPPMATADGNWFVNFGSYRRRAIAEKWLPVLKPAIGEVVVTRGTREGETFYRVRVIKLANKDDAMKVARQLEKEYELSKLWVGQQ
jgi:cell division septation protein DedD